MTRTEIQQAILCLPTSQQAALVEAVLPHLPNDQQRVLVEGLLSSLEGARSRDSKRQDEIQALRARFEAEVAEGLASGEGRVWTKADWDALKRGEYRYPPREDSWATPPGWRSPRLGKRE